MKKAIMRTKGITLVALVITVVVMLILAGVTLNLVLGDNGLLTKSGQAKVKTMVEQEKEQVELAYSSVAAKKLGKNVTTRELQTELDSTVGLNKILVTNSGNIFNVYFYDTDHNFSINGGVVTRVADGNSADASLGDWIAAWVQDSDGWGSTTYYPEDKTDEQLNEMGTVVARLYKNGNTVTITEYEINEEGERVEVNRYVDAYSLVISGEGTMNSPIHNESYGDVVVPIVTAWVKDQNNNYDSEKLSGEVTNVTISDGITNIEAESFYDSRYLTSVTIGNSVTNIGDSVFYYCNSLTNITIGNSVTNIGSRAFYGCRSLTNITIPDSVTNIGNHAFRDCRSLTNITIPDSVTQIGVCAFAGTGLVSVTFEDTLGWFVTNNQESTSGTNVDVTNSSQNAKMLTLGSSENGKKDYYWKKAQ